MNAQSAPTPNPARHAASAAPPQWIRFAGSARVRPPAESNTDGPSDTGCVLVAPQGGGSLLAEAADVRILKVRNGFEVRIRKNAAVTVLERPANPANAANPGGIGHLPAHLIAIGGILISLASGRVVGNH